jgi:hypothetical protein
MEANMRTLTQMTVLLGIALVQSTLDSQARLAAQTESARRYDEAAASNASETPPSSRGNWPSGTPAPLSQRWPPTGEGQLLQGQGASPVDGSFAGNQPVAPEEIPAQGTPPSATALPETTLSTPGASIGSLDASQSQSTTPAHSLAPKEWVERFMEAPEGKLLPGVPLSLDEALEGSVGRQRQTEVVTAYWRLVVAIAKYHAAASTQDVSAAEGELALLSSKLDAIRAQHRLAQVLQLPEGELPLPVSQPHVGSYNTRYKEIFAGRFHRGAWELDQTLPVQFELIKVRSGALSRTGPGTDEFRLAAIGFMESVGEYNLAIAEYALLAAGDSLTGRDLVPLLIRVDRENGQVAAERTGRSSGPSLGRRRIASVTPPDAVSRRSRTGADDAGPPIRSESGGQAGGWQRRESTSPDLP